MNIKVTKASGKVEDLNPAKLRGSLIRSGAEREQADAIIETIIEDIPAFTTTKKIYSLARKYLRQINNASGLRYSLKKALFRLGPSGYPFEKYIGEVLKHYGYSIEIGSIIRGRCVKHEIDVFAVNDNEVLTVECKYRNNGGSSTDVKTAMYVHSRFRDIASIIKTEYPGKSFRGMLITNTRFTTDAIQYADCNGMDIKSWRHPETGGLQEMVEAKQLYPVTVISGVKSRLIKTLFDNNIILLKDLAEMKTETIMKMLSLNKKKAQTLKKQAEDLCFCDDPQNISPQL